MRETEIECLLRTYVREGYRLSPYRIGGRDTNCLALDNGRILSVRGVPFRRAAERLGLIEQPPREVSMRICLNLVSVVIAVALTIIVSLGVNLLLKASGLVGSRTAAIEAALGK